MTVVSPAAGVSWGRPSAAAEQIASFQGILARLAIFGYEREAVMVGLAAPSRRVAFFAADAATERLTPDGLRLLAAAIGWLSP